MTTAMTTAETTAKGELDSITFNNSDFYDCDGNFIEDAAKEAILSLMRYHNSPIYPNTKEQLWVSDYGVGEFTKLGLACVIYANNEIDRYMQLDIYLLPGQMLAEHWHVDPENGMPAKLEGWLVRWGKSYIVGEGEDNMSSFSHITIPQKHDEGKVVAKHIEEVNAGSFAPLKEIYSKHWQYAGEEGAIITEVANCHRGEAVRHTDKTINSAFLGE